MGIKIDLIIPEFRDRIAEILPHFTCTLCDNLFQDAMTLKCQHNFCQSCITRWILRQSDEFNIPCPECQVPFNPEIAMEESHLIRNVLSVFKFNCPIEPCEVIVNYAELTKHSEECPYSFITCKFCEYEILRKNSDDHNVVCISRLMHLWHAG